MYRLHGTVQGVAPLLFSAPPAAGIGEGTNVVPGTVEGREEEAKGRVHRDAEGGIIIPRWMFKKCLLDGCAKANLKVRGNKAMGPFLKATVFADADMPLGKAEPDYILAVNGRRPPGPKGAGVVIRYPAFNPGWSFRFALTVWDDERDPEHIRRALEAAGLLAGLGSWRPEYGRFVVSEWGGKMPA